jgi:acyl dehydratase
MTADRPAAAALEIGQEIGRRRIAVGRGTLVRYAGASGDFNPIHYDDVVAQGVGLPGVIAHGMFTMGAAIDLVADWAGDPGAVVDYRVRFTRPVPVPSPGEAWIEVTGVIGALDPEARTVRIDLAVEFEGAKVLGKAQAVVRLA